MPSLIDLRRRIRAVKSTQQITKAMKMIAASRLRRSQERVVGARPFAQRMLRVLNGLVTRVHQEAHPLLRIPDADAAGRPLLIVITADRGLCGSFNSNVIKAASQFIANDAGRDVALGLIGRKGRDFFRRRGFDVKYEQVNVFARLKFTDAVEIANAAIEAFTSGEASAVYLVYNEFKSAVAQRPVVERLLPISRGEVEDGPKTTIEDYIYEPDPQSLFLRLLPHHVDMQVYRALLESQAAEHAARMSAMSAATINAGELIDQLTLKMNRMRQASITTEIIEVVSGAEALG
jgi:F-type H+-transporting ATPase subunit gamma